MNIALMAHDSKKELMVQFCIAYSGILSHHNLCATGTTGKMVSEATGLEIFPVPLKRMVRICCVCAMSTIFPWQPTSPQPKL